ncbi:MAG TPA: thioredoxin domain-containing protein [Thermoanaerobaculia bacterium]|nr:thioredoxin domain-containing protein [Thermoanaerobaculia bacterium]
MILGALVLAATAASSPIDWHPWGAAALQAAHDQNKPVFLSIGYSTCHWCHVMEQESFSDREIGTVMNEYFIPIKVDREERPDVDSAYMAAARKLMPDPGWPLNMVLTPDGKPIFATAYVPKDRLRAILDRFGRMWKDHPDRIESMAAMVMQSLAPEETGAGAAVGAEMLKKSYEQLSNRFDSVNGGFLPPPKVPAAHQLMFLLRYWKRSGERHALEMVETTLRAMRRGAIWDSKRLGFHRYAVDAAWQEPHFEKMLCDQALLAMVYLETYQATRKHEYARTAREIFTYVLRDLRAPNGAFYTAQDSDDRSARDEKVMSDWNGLMIAALSFGAVVLNDDRYAEAARRSAAVLLAPERLMHQSGRTAYLDDYAFVAWGLLNLYEATFEVRYLEKAIDLEHDALQRFRDDAGRLYLTASDAERLLVRPRETSDGSLPSGNSVQLMNLVRLARITGDARFDKAANDIVRASADEVALIPSASAHLMCGLDFLIGPSFEVVLAGRDVRPLRRAVFSSFVPNKVVLRSEAAIARIAPFTKEQKAISGRATAYVCTSHLCKLPTTDPAKVSELLGR